MIVALLHYRYSQHLHPFFFWRVIILLMRAKCAVPARVNTQLQCVCCTYRLQCTLYNVHKAHLFCTQILYLSKYNWLSVCAMYRLCIGNRYVAYSVCSVYIVYSLYSIHYKYIVEVLGKTIKRTTMIDNLFERKFHGACYRPRFTIFYRLILNKVDDNSKT